MNYAPENPLIVQSDLTVLLEVNSPRYEAARDVLARFAELEKSPEHIHTYRITPLSLWNAAAAGLNAVEIGEALETYGKYEIPQNVNVEIEETIARYGRIELDRDGDHLVLTADDPLLLVEILRHKTVEPYIKERLDDHRAAVEPLYRGHLKQALTKVGFPVRDLAGYLAGSPLSFSLRDETLFGESFALRDYQREASEIFYAGGGPDGGR